MKELFLTILHMSLTGSATILIVLLARLFLKKAPKKYSYWLWPVVGFRLICPVSFSSVFSFFSLLQASKTNQILYCSPASANQLIVHGLGAEIIPETLGTNGFWDRLLNFGGYLWLAGILCFLLHAVLKSICLRRKLSTAIHVEGRVWQSDRIEIPFSFGLVKPKIYMPFHMDNETAQYVLAHEHVHLRHLDHWAKHLAFTILAVHWFNPLCYVAYRYMCRDMEMRCDEAVLFQNPKSAKAYCMSLLAVASRGQNLNPSVLRFGEPDVKRRIQNVLDWKKPGFSVCIAAILLCSFVLLGCGTDPAGSVAPSLSLSSEAALREKYPDFFDLSQERGLRLYLLEESDGCRCALYTENNRPSSMIQLTEYCTASSEEMSQILQTYSLGNNSIFVFNLTQTSFSTAIKTLGLEKEQLLNFIQ